jgi:nicotinate-nucleotide adenylyltransferase
MFNLTNSLMRIAIYPGSFNPVHLGHIHLAGYVVTNQIADEVWMLVSPRNPLKINSELIEKEHRLAMVQLAIAGHPGLVASDFEFQLPRPSYTVDTLKRLQNSYPEHQFVLMIGSDNALIFDKWKDYETILQLVEVYVYPRQGFPTGDALNLYPAMIPIHSPLYPISSTQLRMALHRGDETGEWLSAEVVRYIRLHQLYR